MLGRRFLPELIMLGGMKMTEVAEKTTQEPAEAAEGATAEATAEASAPKAPKPWSDRIVTTVKNGRDNARYARFKEFIDGYKAKVDDVEIVADLDTIALVMSLINPYRLTPEYKKWDEEYRATHVGSGPKVAEPKTPEEAKALLEKAAANKARAQKALANSEARAARAQELLAQLEAEESDDEADVESDELADVTDESEESDDEVSEDQF